MEGFFISPLKAMSSLHATSASAGLPEVSPAKRVLDSEGAPPACRPADAGVAYYSRSVMLCRLIPMVDRLCRSAVDVEGSTPIIPMRIRNELKEMMVR